MGRRKDRPVGNLHGSRMKFLQPKSISYFLYQLYQLHRKILYLEKCKNFFNRHLSTFVRFTINFHNSHCISHFSLKNYFTVLIVKKLHKNITQNNIDLLNTENKNFHFKFTMRKFLM